MADTPEEESIHKPRDTGPDNTPAETNPANITDPITPIQEIDPMDVHHHAHHDGKRNWKSYFWEFLMLFLAVFCGFLAEYQLEHVIEHQREKKLMRTLTDDLSSDKITLQKYIGWRKEINADFDSLLLLLSAANPEANAFQVYKLANRAALRFGLPDINGGTISQLTYSGGLRLVRSKPVTDAINKHYLGLNRMKASHDTERLVRINLVESRAEMLDARLLVNPNPQKDAYTFVSNEPARINQFMHDILAARQMNNGLISQLDSFSVSTDKLHALIDKEYHFN